MQIPYNEELRPDTGLYNAKLGIWIFLASEIMLFGGLFSAYIMLRVGAPIWPPLGTAQLNIPMATFNTVVLITSSVTMVMAWASLKMNNFGKFKMYMGLTLLFSAMFLVVKYFEYSAKLSHGFTPAHDTFLAIYYTMTGLHVIHIIGGMLVNYYLWKQFDSSSKEKMSRWFSLLALLILLLPWSSFDERVVSRGFETSIGTLLFSIVVLSLVSSKLEKLKPFYCIFVGFGFLVTLLSFNQFNSYGYYLFLIITGVTLFDNLLATPQVTFENNPERFTNRIEIAGLYWHFVDLVWIFLFPVLYLL